MQEFRPGDVVRYPNGGLDYLLGTDDGELWVNACSESYISRGLLSFGQHVYPFTDADRAQAEVVGHFGNGSITDAGEWYKNNREAYV